MVPKDKKRGLGRGLSALMADVNEAEKVTVESAASGVRMVPIEQVKPNPDQPASAVGVRHRWQNCMCCQ